MFWFGQQLSGVVSEGPQTVCSLHCIQVDKEPKDMFGIKKVLEKKITKIMIFSCFVLP